MSDVPTYNINSADSHVLEPQDLWVKELPAKYTERALKVVQEGLQEVAIIDGIESRRARIDKGDSATGVGPRPPGHSRAKPPSRRPGRARDLGRADVSFPWPVGLSLPGS